MRSFQVPATPGTCAWPPKLSVGAYFAGHASYFGGEHAELLNHGVDDVGGAKELAFERAAIDVEPDGLRQVALRDGGDGAGDFGRGPEQILDQRIDRDFHLAPRSSGLVKAGALARLAFLADCLTDALEFLRHLLVGSNDFIERVGYFARQTNPSAWEPHRKVTIPHGLQAGQNDVEIQRSVGGLGFPIAFRKAGREVLGIGRCIVERGSFHGLSRTRSNPSTVVC